MQRGWTPPRAPKRRTSEPPKEEILEEKIVALIPAVASIPEPEPVRFVDPPMSRAAFANVLKKARKKSAFASNRPRISSTWTPTPKRGTAKAVPRKEPELILCEALYHEMVERACRVFKPQRVLKSEQVMGVLLDPMETGAGDPDALIKAHALDSLERDVIIAQEKKDPLRRRNLHSMATRALGRLIATAWERVNGSRSILDERAVINRLRRGGMRGFDVLQYRDPEEGIELYFLLETSIRRSKRVLHCAWGPVAFQRWLRQRKRSTRHSARSSKR
ncbi:MAG: hypothetical protein WC787_01425 [Patescibacteria group bacterium]